MALLVDLLDHAPSGSGRAIVGLVALVFVLNILFWSTKYCTVSGSPVAGRKWWFEPLILTRYRFLLNGWSVTQAGWDQVSTSVVSYSFWMQC